MDEVMEFFHTNTEKKKIMVVEDNRSNVQLLQNCMEKEGYEIIIAYDGKSALKILKQVTPDLIILDIVLPGIDGYGICRRIRKNIFLSHIPILMLTAKARIKDRIKGLDEGANDYLCKPYKVRELVARVRALLRHSESDIDRNPSTNLPGPQAIEQDIITRIQNQDTFAVCYLDLDNFKPYADTYGFDMANRVIKSTGRIISGVVLLYGDKTDFVGHIGGDDFIVVTTPDRTDQLCSKIIEEFDQQIEGFFKENDLERGFYMGKDRGGKIRKFPILSISISAVINQSCTFSNLSEVSLAIAKIKHFAKSLPGSSYYRLQRD